MPLHHLSRMSSKPRCSVVDEISDIARLQLLLTFRAVFMPESARRVDFDSTKRNGAPAFSKYILISKDLL